MKFRISYHDEASDDIIYFEGKKYFDEDFLEDFGMALEIINDFEKIVSHNELEIDHLGYEDRFYDLFFKSERTYALKRCLHYDNLCKLLLDKLDDYVNEYYEPRYIAVDDEPFGCLQDHLSCSYDKLVSVFGEPNESSDPYKTKYEWVILDRETGFSFTIYDYKGEQWHIGGDRKPKMKDFIKFLNSQ